MPHCERSWGTRAWSGPSSLAGNAVRGRRFKVTRRRWPSGLAERPGFLPKHVGDKFGQPLTLLRPGVMRHEVLLHARAPPVQFGPWRLDKLFQRVPQAAVIVVLVEIVRLVAQDLVRTRNSRREDGAATQRVLEDFRGEIILVARPDRAGVDQDIPALGQLQTFIRGTRAMQPDLLMVAALLQDGDRKSTRLNSSH